MCKVELSTYFNPRAILIESNWECFLSQKMVKRSSEHVTTTRSWTTSSCTDSFKFSCKPSKMPKTTETRRKLGCQNRLPKTSNCKFLGVLAGELYREICCLMHSNQLEYPIQSLISVDKKDHNDVEEHEGITMYVEGASMCIFNITMMKMLLCAFSTSSIFHVKGIKMYVEDAPRCTFRIRISIPDNPGGYAKTAVDLSNKTHKMKERTPEVEECIWDSAPDDIQVLILRKLKYEDMSRAKIVSQGMKTVIESPLFRNSVSELGFLTSLFLYTKNGALQWSGFDIHLQEWRSLPTLACLLPSPGPNYLFKEYLVAAGCGLLCANISKSIDHEEIVVCNPMTQKIRVLPPLNSRRNPVLMHILVDPTTNSYKVIVAGSSGMTQGHLSKETEVYDSNTEAWTKTGDLPGPEFGLNEYQTGVCVNGKLYCVAFLEDGSSKGVVAYDVKEGRWLTDWKCPLPCSGSPTNSSSVAQVVECDGEVYLFSEHENGNVVEHRIDKMMASHTSFGRWTNVVHERKSGGRGLLVYPERACVGFGEGKLCVFNTLELTGKVYDVRKGGDRSESLIVPSPGTPLKGGGAELFHSLNPLSFTFQPNFQTEVRKRSPTF